MNEIHFNFTSFCTNSPKFHIAPLTSLADKLAWNFVFAAIFVHTIV